MPVPAAVVAPLIAAFEVAIAFAAKVLALRFILQVSYVAVGAGITYGVYSAVNGFLTSWVIPAAPGYVGTGLYVINWGALSVLVSLYISVETTIAVGAFSLRQLRMLSTH